MNIPLDNLLVYNKINPDGFLNKCVLLYIKIINVLWHVTFYGTGGYVSLYQVPQFDTLRNFHLVRLHSYINV